ncbi:putative lysophospholipase L1 biosynthesis ABC-type transport system permease subunit [Paraburkholderia sp. MM5482-R2]
MVLLRVSAQQPRVALQRSADTLERGLQIAPRVSLSTKVHGRCGFFTPLARVTDIAQFAPPDQH